MLSRAILSVFLFGFLITSVSAQASHWKKQSTKEILSSPTSDCRDFHDNPINFSTKTTIAQELWDLRECLDVPVGIVLTHDLRETRFQFSPAGLTARDVLDSIVEVAPSYAWSVEDGVIEFLPTYGVPPLLEVRLSSFAKHGVIISSIFPSLETRPEVVSESADLGFVGPQVAFLYQGFVDSRKYDLDCRDCTVREILNSISRLDGSSWMYAECTNEDSEPTYRLGFFSFTNAYDYGREKKETDPALK